MATLPELLKTMVEMDGSDLHIATDTPPQVRVHGHLQRLQHARAHAGRDQAARLQRAHRRAEEALRRNDGARLLVRHQGVGSRFRCNVFNQRGAVGAVYRLIPEKIRTFGELGLPPVLADARRSAARPGARHRPDRQRQVDDAGGDARQDQLGAPRAHPHDRGSDRVHPPAQELPGEPARGAQRHQQLRQRAARRAARGSGHRPDRRDARSRDGRSGAEDRRDGAPDVRHAAHQLGGADDQPHHRHLSGGPAGADPHAAVARARRHRLSGAAAAGRRQGARLLARDHGADAGDPEPDSRRQDPPDLRLDAGRPGKARACRPRTSRWRACT